MTTTTKTSQTDSLLRGSSAPLYPLRRARSGDIRFRHGSTFSPLGALPSESVGEGHNLSPSERVENAGSRGFLGRGSTFTLLGAPPSESVGRGMTLPLVSLQRMPGAEGFSLLFYSELEWSAAVVVHVGGKM